jgi:RNA polymerase sigma-70 factor (ECF subfamily)
VRAISNIHLFRSGSNMAGWLTVILRNKFRGDYRREKKRSQACYPQGRHQDPITLPDQQDLLHWKEFAEALDELPSKQSEVLMLLGDDGLSYEEIAHIRAISVGTVKSRVSRARARLRDVLSENI